MKKQQKVAFLGPKYTYSHEAALKIFPKDKLFGYLTPQEVFRKVQGEEMDYGILPAENSATGIIQEFYPLLLDQDFGIATNGGWNSDIKVQISKELYLPIQHHLLSKTDVGIEDVKILCTFRQPYLQCIDWINEHLPGVEIQYANSTAAAAQMLSQNDGSACIGGDLLCNELGLIKIQENVQDYSKNVTRFFAISGKRKRVSNKDNKSTFAIIIPDQVGTLLEVLKTIASKGINLVNIRTLPIRDAKIFSADFKDWFVIDVDITGKREAYEELLESFQSPQSIVLSHKLIGTYFSKNRLTKKPKIVSTESARKSTKGITNKKKFYADLISKGESENVEFKSTLRYDIKSKKVNKELSKAIAKTVCGFLNTKGGYLFIGVADTGEILGIEYDVNVLSKGATYDNYMRVFYQLIIDMLGEQHSLHALLELIDLRNKKVACVKISASEKPCWLKGEEFYIRVGNATKRLTAKQSNEYILSRIT